MKFSWLISVVLLLASCKGSTYYGVIYDFEKKRPIAGVEIDDYLNSKKTVSDSSGYFSLDHGDRISGRLIFKKAGYQVDTLETISNYNGEQLVERFKGDTVFLFAETSNYRDSIATINASPANSTETD
jgi:hypothetical protein